MSQIEVILCACDECGLFMRSTEIPAMTVRQDRARAFNNHTEALRAMRERGWTYSADFDVCPDCQRCLDE